MNRTERSTMHRRTILAAIAVIVALAAAAPAGARDVYLYLDEAHGAARQVMLPIAATMDGDSLVVHTCRRLSPVAARCRATIAGPQPSQWLVRVREDAHDYTVDARILIAGTATDWRMNATARAAHLVAVSGQGAGYVPPAPAR